MLAAGLGAKERREELLLPLARPSMDCGLPVKARLPPQSNPCFCLEKPRHLHRQIRIPLCQQPAVLRRILWF